MQATYEFRVRAERAHLLFSPHEGGHAGATVRKVAVRESDPRFRQIGELDRTLRRETGTGFFYSYNVKRRYTPSELRDASAFRLDLAPTFEPSGEECGTVYDDLAACPECGSGGVQKSDLVLDFRKLPKNKDIAKTIAGTEWIVSQRLAQAMLDAGIQGYELGLVRHKSRFQDDQIDFTDLPSGRSLLARAEALAIPIGSWQFWVWVNRPDQEELLAKAWSEFGAVERDKERAAQTRWPRWYQLKVTSPPVRMIPPTRFGIDPFDDDPQGEYRCRHGHTAGLNLQSEVFFAQSNLGRSDIFVTSQCVGRRVGLLRPNPILIVSPRLRQLLLAEGVRGGDFEVAYLTESHVG